VKLANRKNEVRDNQVLLVSLLGGQVVLNQGPRDLIRFGGNLRSDVLRSLANCSAST
jgi:hypothetical protein